MNNTIVMNAIRRIWKPHRLKEIFTPTIEEKLTYVTRETIEKELEKNISIPGQQIIIYGHSGSGKTTLLRNQGKNQGIRRTEKEINQEVKLAFH